MTILFVRHAIAMDREKFKKRKLPDSERPLTATGRRKMKKIARHLSQCYSKPILISSPYTRALDTARILEKSFGVKTKLEDALAAHQKPELMLAKIKKLNSQKPVILVGHEPLLGQIISKTLGIALGKIELKKGGWAEVHVLSLKPFRARLKNLVDPQRTLSSLF